jgi:hypothetical protein
MPLTTAIRNQITGRIGSAINQSVSGGLQKLSGSKTANPNAGALNSFGGSSNKFSKKILTYPTDIATEGQGHYIVFEVKVYTPPKIKMTTAKAVLGSVGGALDKQIGTKSNAKSSGKSKDAAKQEGATPDKQHASQAEINKLKKDGKASGAKSRKQIASDFAKSHHTDNIAIYMPASVNVSYSAGYADQEIGILSEIGSDVILGMMQGYKGGGIGGALSAGYKKAKSSIAAGGSQMLLEYGLKTLDGITIVPGMEGAKAVAQR